MEVTGALTRVGSSLRVTRGEGIQVAVIAALLAFALIGLGLRGLSVAPRSVALVKRIVRSVTVEAAVLAAHEALAAPTAAIAEQGLRRRFIAALGDDPFLRGGLPGLA